MKKRYAFAIVALLLIGVCAGAASAKTAKEVWADTDKTLDQMSDIQGLVSVFTYYPPSIRQYFPDLDVELKDNKVGWRYQIFQYTWKKPRLIHIEFKYARNIGKDIVGKMLESKPGTRLVFGYKDTENIYAKFPPTGDKSIDKQIDRQIFFIPFNTKEYAAAIMSGLNFSGTIAGIMDTRKHYFTDGKVAVAESKSRPMKIDFKFDTAPQFTRKDVKGDYYVLTLTPNNMAKNQGIEKEIVYINKKTDLPEQIEVYHKGILCACFMIDDVKFNQKLDTSLWDSFYKNAHIIKNTGK